MNETLLDHVARVLGHVPIDQSDGVNVTLGPSICHEMAYAALAVVQPEIDRLRQRIAELEPDQSRVLPAKFITDAMAQIPDALPPDFA
ncbi:hypothetical protein [Streptomyces sp. XH2]|uniref:hypothetical protein n=1 Tax=Streptomyces sp. XH2 TaxID=3412483 RepID=UPI003C7C72B8